jgi:hypothetical protein
VYIFELIKKPINNFYFAGEHTSEKYNGYVNGAYESGINVANDIINNIRYKSNYFICLTHKIKKIFVINYFIFTHKLINFVIYYIHYLIQSKYH